MNSVIPTSRQGNLRSDGVALRDHGVTLLRDLELDLAPCWMDRDGIHRCLPQLGHQRYRRLQRKS